MFEHVFAQAARIEQAGIIACPGVGFDVIPTDCVAARLKEALPDARELSLGFSTRSVAGEVKRGCSPFPHNCRLFACPWMTEAYSSA